MRTRRPADAADRRMQHTLTTGAGALRRLAAAPVHSGELEPVRRPVDQDAATDEQRRLWLLDRINPGHAALHLGLAWTHAGTVSRAQLDAAWSGLLARHQILRTGLRERDGTPWAHVESEPPAATGGADLCALGTTAAATEWERLAQLDARAPFNLAKPPLVRLSLWQLPDGESRLQLTAHRAICDETSLHVIAQELEQDLRPTAAPRLAPRRSYGELSAARAAAYTAGQRSEDEAYWARTLAGLRCFELQCDFPRPPVQTAHARVAILELEPAQAAGLARNSGDAALPLAALYALLRRYSGETDIAIGYERSGRGPGTERLVGPLAQILPLRLDLGADLPFAELVARVRAAAAEAEKHSALPLGRIIELLRLPADLSRNPLYSISFSERLVSEDRHLASAHPWPSPTCDLHLCVERGPGIARLCLEYNADLFEAESIERLLRHYANLLHSGLCEPAQPLSALSIIDAQERLELVSVRNRTETEYPRTSTAATLISEQAQQNPERVALICGEQTLSYGELERAANRLAHALRAQGVGQGSLVGICLDRSPDLVIALLAVLKSGAAYVPLDPAYPRTRLAQILEDAQPGAILTRSALNGRCDAGTAHRLLLDRDAAAIEARPDSPPPVRPAPTDRAYVIFTSGSTGRPKGVQITHGALCNFLCAMRSEPGLSPQDTLLAVTTVSFDIAVLELLLPLASGARIVLAQEEETGDGHALQELMTQHAVSVLQATPVTWQLLIAAGWQGGTSLKALCGGEALPRALAEQLLLRGCDLWNLYGPTETTVWSSALRVESGSGPVPVGPPIANTQFYVLDPGGQLAPTGVPGELCIGGDGVAPGYLNRPELTRERFVPDPFSGRPGALLYRTGDLVRWRGAALEFMGRSDHQVKLRGFRIELGEIESVLRAQPGVADCVAVAAVDARGEGAINAYVAVPGTSEETAASLVTDLHASLRQALPAYMCPSSITVLESLPRTLNGKIDRRSLPAPAAPPADPVGTAAGSDAERRLLAIWAELLQRPGLTASSNFFESGGHSMLAVRLLARIEAEFGRKLSLPALFRHPTLREQARLLEQGQDGRSFDFRQVVRLQRGGSQPPLIAINNTGIYFALARRLGPEQPFTTLQLFDPALPPASLPQTIEAIAAGYTQLIRRVQPKGPYALLGWCVAGTLAFEVARQLSAAGHEVSQLALFDTMAPGHLRRLPFARAVLADTAYRMQLIAADWRRQKAAGRGMSAFLQNRESVKKLSSLLRGGGSAPGAEAGAGAAAAPHSQYDQWLLRHLEVAAAAYEPQPYTGKAILFRSSTEPAGPFIDPGMGWGPFVRGGLEVVVIDGDHFSIFQEPQVAQIALHLARSGKPR